MYNKNSSLVQWKSVAPLFSRPNNVEEVMAIIKILYFVQNSWTNMDTCKDDIQ